MSESNGPSPARSRRQRVLYVGGWGRSGSTLLSRLLHEVEGVEFVGEARDLWLRGVQENRLCGCGDPFHECVFWSAVGQEAFGGWSGDQAEEMMSLRRSADRPWHPLVRQSPLATAAGREATARYREAIQRVFDAIRDVSGARLIVDSSKIPSFGHVLASLDGMDVRVAHLVRDARGSVFSWQKSVQRPDSPDKPGTMIQYSPVPAAARYSLYNAQAERLGRRVPYMRLRYEDLVADPHTFITRTLSFAGHEDVSLDHIDGNRIKLGVSHTVVGNPMRMNSGWIDLKLDTEWQEKLSGGTMATVTTLTGPLLRRYGYRLGRG